MCKLLGAWLPAHSFAKFGLVLLLHRSGRNTFGPKFNDDKIRRLSLVKLGSGNIAVSEKPSRSSCTAVEIRLDAEIHGRQLRNPCNWSGEKHG